MAVQSVAAKTRPSAASQKHSGAPPQPSGTPAPAPPIKKKKRLLTYGLIGLLVLIGLGASLYFTQSGANAKPSQEPKKKGPPTFLALEPFTVNLSDREHYLQLGLTYEVAATADAELLKAHLPILRSRILLLLSSKDGDALISQEGKAKLSEELVGEARKTVPWSSAEQGVKAVHFSAFVIQ
jgi:flagellar FliL protein